MLIGKNMKTSDKKLFEIKEKVNSVNRYFSPSFSTSDWSELMCLKFFESIQIIQKH